MENRGVCVKLKLDENLSRHLKPVLNGLGHDTLTAADEGLLSRPDTEVAAASIKEGRMLFTLDVEFADLRKHPPGMHPGIVLFRPPSFGPLTVNGFIADFVRTTDLGKLESCVAVVEPDRIRIRSPEMTKGALSRFKNDVE
jgi:predicted nuclease of predicted toxin-antitoxin system